jgi:hypothetical protein
MGPTRREFVQWMAVQRRLPWARHSWLRRLIAPDPKCRQEEKSVVSLCRQQLKTKSPIAE